jgi:hypothetical protein
MDPWPAGSWLVRSEKGIESKVLRRTGILIVANLLHKSRL